MDYFQHRSANLNNKNMLHDESEMLKRNLINSIQNNKDMLLNIK